MKKIILSLAIISLVVFASTTNAAKTGLTDTIMEYVDQSVAALKAELSGEIAQLRVENAQLRSDLNAIKGQTTTTTGITMPYYRYNGSQDVFETGTKRHIGYEEAVAKDIWNKIQVIY